MDTNQINVTSPTPAPAPNAGEDTRLVDTPVDNEMMALNVIVSFVVQAQKRGAFSLEESAKIWECIKLFQKK